MDWFLEKQGSDYIWTGFISEEVCSVVDRETKKVQRTTPLPTPLHSKDLSKKAEAQTLEFRSMMRLVFCLFFFLDEELFLLTQSQTFSSHCL